MERRIVRISGRVQGVGFRDHIIEQAQRYPLAGFVRNAGEGVEIDIEGAAEDLDAFLQLVEREPPFLARIDNVQVERAEPTGRRGFKRAATTW